MQLTDNHHMSKSVSQLPTSNIGVVMEAALSTQRLRVLRLIRLSQSFTLIIDSSSIPVSKTSETEFRMLSTRVVLGLTATSGQSIITLKEPRKMLYTIDKIQMSHLCSGLVQMIMDLLSGKSRLPRRVTSTKTQGSKIATQEMKTSWSQISQLTHCSR